MQILTHPILPTTTTCFVHLTSRRLVRCSQCEREYMSSLMEWREDPMVDPLPGIWCCPIKGCDGKGYGLDVAPPEA